MSDVAIKPLDWQEHDEEWWGAESPVGLSYEVRVTSRGLVRFRFYGGQWDYASGTLDDAKAAAQADYEKRVRAALLPCREGTDTA